jgi:diguanylate cyclase (GGDEF)-like protein
VSAPFTSPVTGWRVRGWELWSLPSRLPLYLLGVESVALVLTVRALFFQLPSVSGLIRCGIFLGLFLLFQRPSARIERLRIKLSESHKIDMTSVWTFAAVVAVPGGYAALLSVIIAALSARTRLRSGQQPHRQIFNAATVALACLAGSEMLHLPHPAMAGVSDGALGAVSMALAIAVYTTVNTALVSGAIFLASHPMPVRALFGTWEENALELATLCLGALTAVTAIYLPWLTALAIVPMVVLQRGALVKQLEVAATTDQKTGLLNAVTWSGLAEKELARASRDGKSGAMLIIDMDRFKAVNDTYGHMVGDAVLKAASAALTTELREYDTVGRFGGEEFVALLPDVDQQMVAGITDRILERIRTLQIVSPDNPDIRVGGFSASIGIALFPEHGTEVERLLHAADLALYQAKDSGRDRARFGSVVNG